MSNLMQIAAQVVGKVAPQWPLPQWVAVNPLWEYRQQSVTDIAAEWRYCGGVSLTMPTRFYQQELERGNIDRARVTESMQTALTKKRRLPRWRNISHLVDKHQQRRRKMLWHDEVVVQISQSCGLFIQFPRRFQGEASASSLYRHWLIISRADRGIETLMDEEELNELFAALPDSPEALFEACQNGFLAGVDDDALRCYCQAMVTELLGWASALSFQDRQQGSAWLMDLLAIRLAWDYLLWQLADCTNKDVFERIKQDFAQQIEDREQDISTVRAQQQPLWQWQQAYEQSQLAKLKFTADANRANEPELQAVFCIDVRSERYRRALESAGAENSLVTESKGFAGFFGAPLGRQDEKMRQTPHVPGLLSPSFYLQHQRNTTPFKELLTRSFNSPASMFSGVEALGISKLVELLRGKKGLLDTARYADNATLYHNGVEASAEQLVDICVQALTGMQFQQFAKHIVLVGHGAKHSNNAQRAGMNCGACGGQTGAMSARVLCQLLNRTDIRQQLRDKGLSIPAATQFYAALHETVTDDIVWLSDDVPAHVKATFARASQALQSDQTQRQTRANHWAELRPEWGLAGNQALFFGDANRLAKDNPQGHTFLHDYQAANDPQGDLLAGLLSAPGLVANWINWQYYSSVTSPARMGSGNKLLHNRVANDIGVFEGNAGDLRLGLAWQSVHDGHDLVHKPVRLNVIIQAQPEQIQQALEKADDFNALWRNGWLALYRLTDNAELNEISL